MNILFVIKSTYVHERLGVMHLSSVLKQDGHKVRLIVVENIGLEGCSAVIEEFAPEIVGYSAMTGCYDKLRETNIELKKRHKCKITL